MPSGQTWLQIAERVVREKMKTIPYDTDAKETRRRLNESYPFGPRKHWPYKQWLRAVKAAMQYRHYRKGGRIPSPSVSDDGGPDLFAGVDHAQL